MTGTRIVIAVLLVAGLTAQGRAGDDPPAPVKPRPDPSRVRFLAELLRSAPDEKQRKAAATELAEADPRTHPEVMPALLAALKRDAATVRATAAEVIGKFKTTFPLAGSMLESIAETDPDPTVRKAAKQALWDYHLNGYRSPKTSDVRVGQTAEPPFAVATSVRVAPAVVLVPEVTPPSMPTSLAHKLPVLEVPHPKPAVVPVSLIGPRTELFEGLNRPRRLLSLPLRPTFTSEPPLAKRPALWTPPPTIETEPPLFIRLPDHGVFRAPPVMPFDLPAIVPNPGPLPGVPQYTEPTPEPPVRKVTRK